MQFPSLTSSQITLLSLTHSVLFTLYRIAFKVSDISFFLQSVMLLPLHLISSRLSSASSPGFCDTPLAFSFILYSFFSAHNPTESWLSFLCRLWPWCIPIRGSRILGDPRGRVGRNHLWEKLLQLYSKGPLSVSLVSSPHQSFQFCLQTPAAMLCSNVEGNMCADWQKNTSTSNPFLTTP